MRGIAATCIGILALACACLAATQVVKGAVVTAPEGAASVQVRVGDKVVEVRRTKNTVITRGEDGKTSRAVALREFVRGDRFVAIIEDGETISMRAIYDAPKPPVRPVGPLKINSITFSAPVPLKPGDVITVDLSGTPKAKAAFSVKNFIPVVWMKEMSPGSYHGTVKVPKDKTVRNAPLVGYLGVGDAHAPPMQASRLITLQPESEETLLPSVPPLRFVQPAKLPVVKPANPPVIVPQPAPAVKPVEPPKAVIRPTPPVAKPAIVLSSPIDGGRVRRAILVRGTADPNSDVKVTITYSNNLTGLLKLGGEVASQNVSVGKNGEFRMGPIALDGPLATNGLRFSIKAYYPDRAEHGTALINVTGDRD